MPQIRMPLLALLCIHLIGSQAALAGAPGRVRLDILEPSGRKTPAALPCNRRDATVPPMGKSSITKHFHTGAGSSAAREVGRRVRERRLAIGLTQTELAVPLSKGFVSAVENGQSLPSLGTLWLFASRLGTGVGELVDGVNGLETPEYTPVDGGPRAGPGSSGSDRAKARPRRR